MLFAVIFLVLGFLKSFGVMTYNETRRIIFNWITLFGALWPITDLIWALASKNRRKRVCLMDKFLVIPLPIFLITFDLISLIAKPTDTNFYVFSIAAAFFYVSAIYLFQSIYHYFNPLIFNNWSIALSNTFSLTKAKQFIKPSSDLFLYVDK